MTVEMKEKLYEEEALDLLNIVSEEQASFDSLSTETKLSRLDTLVQKSQVYSKIIAENLMVNMKAKSKENVANNKNKQKKGTRSRSRGSKDSKPQDASSNQPNLISGVTMRDYQLEGLNFLVSLYENGLNGILADEMGLGKTLQCILFIAFLMEQGITGPFLVVAPLSTVGNWANEFKRFAPQISVVSYIGIKDDREALRGEIDFNNINVVLTSYEISIRDHGFIKSIPDLKYLIVDEGHRLKNNQCLLIQKLKELQVSNRLLITGTPLQNNLNELWSLLNFILPDIFHDLHLFQQWFNFEELRLMKKDSENQLESKLIEINIQKALIENLHTILRPFILRRLKKDVVKNLPPKKEYIVYVNMTEKQKQLYQATLNGQLFNTIVRMYFVEYMKNTYKLKFSVDELEAFVDGDFQEELVYIDTKRRKTEKRSTLKEAESDDEFEENDGEEVEEEDEEEDEDDEIANLKLLPKPELLGREYHRIFKQVRNKKLQNIVMQLRNVSNSPYIFYDPFPVEEDNLNNESRFMKVFEENSAKLQVFRQLVDALLAQKHRILIFSQFTKMLDLLSDWFRYCGIDTARLDGSNSQAERQATIDEFNNGSNSSKNSGPPVFLLSTRAGGLGINLTAADTVILFDSDWNPQMDLQAIDRVHRIGQTKPVKIYRFVVRDSVEEVLLFKSYSKKILNKLIIRMNAHKIESIEKMLTAKGDAAEEADELMKNLKDFIELPTAFNENFDKKRKRTRNRTNGTVTKVHNELSKAEMTELLDRSPECYKNDTIEFGNIAIFETINNMEK